MQRRRGKRDLGFLFLLLFFGFAGCAPTTTGSSSDIPRMTIEALAQRLDAPDTVIIDVRLPSEQQNTGAKIQGARQENPNRFSDWADEYPKTSVIVLYCS